MTCVAQVSFKPVYSGLRQDAVFAKDSTGHVLSAAPVIGTGQGAAFAILPPLISTIAGDQVFAYSGDRGPALTASFGYPQGIATDQLGNIYISDYLNAAVRRIDARTQIISTIAGTGQWGYSGDNGPATAAKLSGPVGLAFDPAGNLFIADSGNNVVRRIDANGVITTVVGGGGSVGMDGLGDPGPAIGSVLLTPLGLAFDTAGNLYIADSQNNLVRKVNTTTGAISVFAGGGNSPGTDGFGNGGPAVGCSLAGPSGLAVDHAGNVLIADTGNSMVRKVDGANHMSLFAGVGGPGFSGDGALATQAMLFGPNGLAIDAAQNVYIADSNNNVIRKVNSATGTISTIAGVPASGYAGDGGSAKTALLYSPMGIAANGLGDLFIADYGNNVIRKLSANSAPITFPTVNAGSTSWVKQVVVSNIGNLSTAAPAVTVGSGFQIRSSDPTLCQSQNTLAPGATCTASALFAPAVAGAYAGLLTLGSSNPALNAQVALNGFADGIARSATSPSLLGFGSVAVGSASAGQIVTLSNVGTAPLTVGTVALASSDFSLQTDACSGTVLAAGANCAVSVKFLPQAVGARSGNLVISDSTIDSPHAVSLSGTGLSVPNVSISTTALGFGNQLLGLRSNAQTVTLQNGGTAAQPLIIGLTGSSDFSQTNSCGTSLAAGANCYVAVVFSPVAVGNRSGALALFTDSTGAVRTVGLSGVGVGVPNVTVSTTALVFGNQVLGTTSAVQTVTLQNAGTAAQALNISLSNTSDFSGTNTCGASLAAGASCQISVAFSPGVVGNRSASLAIFTNSTGAARSVSLSGTALPIPAPSCGGLGSGNPGPSTRIGAVPLTATFSWNLDYNGSACSPSLVPQILFGSAGDIPVVGDWSGNGRAKAGVWRVTNGVGRFFLDTNGNGWDNDVYFIWGQTGDIPVVGDWTGDGRAKVGVFRPATGFWILDANNSHDVSQATQIHFGSPGDVPLVGDWTGDHRAKPGVWRPTLPGFYLDLADGNWDSAQDIYFVWGQAGDIPVVGDWSGDGKSKVGVFRASVGLWFLDLNNSHQMPSNPLWFGSPGDVPVVGDWNGTGVTYVGVWRPTGPGFWIDVNGNGYDAADKFLPWANSTAIPVVGKW